MSDKNNSQKFIGRNRPPRVQIEYDLHTGGASKKVEIPFVMGVLADLTGKPKEPLAAVKDREFLDIDVDNFDQRLKKMQPRVEFTVENVLTNQGNLPVQITFESMDDFTPAKIAEKVDGLKELFLARKQLSNLMTYIDGKESVEKLLTQLIDNPALLSALSAEPKPADSADSADAQNNDEQGE